jgi:ribonuclease-3
VLTGEFGPDHDKVFTVKVVIDDNEIAEGSGGSKQLAEKSAAAAAILKIGIKEE